jgi:hypothetical protein
VLVLFLSNVAMGLVHSPVILMVVIAALLYLLNRLRERPYSWWSAAVLGITGVPFYWIRLPEREAEFVPYLLGGAWLFVRGFWALIQYLRDNPLAREASCE